MDICGLLAMGAASALLQRGGRNLLCQFWELKHIRYHAFTFLAIKSPISFVPTLVPPSSMISYVR